MGIEIKTAENIYDEIITKYCNELQLTPDRIYIDIKFLIKEIAELKVEISKLKRK